MSETWFAECEVCGFKTQDWRSKEGAEVEMELHMEREHPDGDS